MTLSARQIELIQSNFKAVAPIADQAAEIFYNKLFEYDPKLRALFKSDMKQQGAKLMKTLGVAVAALRDLDNLVPVLQDLARKHVGYGVSMDDYTPVGNALLYTLKTGLGSQFTREAREAWVALLHVVVNVMRSAAYSDYNPDTYVNRKSYNR